MKKNQQVRIQKLKPTGNPLAPTPSKEGYAYGQINHNVSLPKGYIAEGTLMEDVVEGKPVFILRSSRNGVEIAGLFNTTPVVKIDGNKVYTKNSVYEITEIV